MAITVTLRDNNFVTNAGPWTTVSTITPTGVITALPVAITVFGGGTAPTSLAASGCGLAWSAENNIDNSTALTSCWTLKGTGTGTSGQITITPTGGTSLKEANYSVIDIYGCDSSPILQSVTSTMPSANPQKLTITLSALGDASNNAVFMFTAGGSTAAPKSGYTEISDLMNNVALETEWNLPGDTTPSCTGDSNFFGQAGIAWEIKAAVVNPPNGGYYLQEDGTSKFTLEDGSGFYLIESWATSSAISMPPFIYGDLNGIGGPGRFFKERIS